MSVPGIPLISIRPKCGNQTIELFWQPPASDGGSAITAYGIAVYDTGGGGVFFHSVGPTIRRYTITGLTNGLKYVPKVRAINAIGASPEAVYRTVEPGLRPSVPQNAAAAAAGGTAALVTWDAPTGDGGADIGWYVVESSSNNAADPVVKFSAHGYDRQRYVSGLSGISDYTFKVYAVNDPGYSPVAITNHVNYDVLASFNASTYSGSGPWNDDSGNGRDATIENGTAAKNTAGNGIVLDGSTNWRFDPIGSQSIWSVSTWFKRTGNSQGDAALLTELFTGSTLNLGIFSNGNPTNFKGGFFNGGFQTGAYQLFPLNTWQQMTVTWDGTYVKTYINGALVDTTDLSGQTSSSVSNNYYRIGCRWDFTEFVLGEIGELIVYPRVLSGGEISSHYTATLPTY